MKKTKKVCLIAGIIGVAAVAGAAINNANKTPEMSDLMTKNLELLTQSEWDGWVVGFSMESIWRPTGGGVSAGNGSVGIHFEGEYIKCCKSASPYDACNHSESNGGC